MYYDEEEYFDAVRAYKKAEVEADKIKSEVFSFTRGEMPRRSMNEEDIAVMQKSHDAWDKVLEVSRRPLQP